ncbi:MAG: hypothetical protein K8R41_08090 [Bacteroidales bacterium]|nr:hypothetical protein [Bacteroidales bacterium]
MKTLLTIIFTIILSVSIFSQETDTLTGYIDPGQSFTNPFNETLVFMTTERVDRILKMNIQYSIATQKIALLEKQISTMQERTFLSDSAIAIKQAEAEFWRLKLLNNDLKLEDQRKINLKLADDKRRLRNSRLYYFVGGGLVATLVYIGVK